MELDTTLKVLTSKCKKVFRNERLALKLTQEEFSKLCGIKYATYKQFEQTGKISLSNFLKVVIFLNKNIEFERFLDSFEFDTNKVRVKKEKSKE